MASEALASGYPPTGRAPGDRSTSCPPALARGSAGCARAHPAATPGMIAAAVTAMLVITGTTARAADLGAAREAIVAPFNALAAGAPRVAIGTVRLHRSAEEACRAAVRTYRPEAASGPEGLDPGQLAQVEAECVTAARGANQAVVNRHVAEALAVDPDSLDQWEAAAWSPGYERDIDWVDGGNPQLLAWATNAYRQAYEAGMGPRRNAAARHWAGAIAATFAVETGLEPPAASFLCANRGRDPADANLNAMFGMRADPTAERRSLETIRAKLAVTPSEAEAWITLTCRTLHDDTIAARVALATAAAKVPGTFADGELLGVPSHADGHPQEVNPTALVKAAAVDGIQVAFTPGGTFWGGPAIRVTPFGRGSPRLEGTLKHLNNPDGTRAAALTGLQPLHGTGSPEDTIACLMTPVAPASAEAKAQRLRGLGTIMLGGYPEDGGRTLRESLAMQDAVNACAAAKAAFVGEQAP